MRLITRFELAVKNTDELHLLYRYVFNALVQTDYGTAGRRNCLASLENIHREMNQRTPRLDI